MSCVRLRAIENVCFVDTEALNSLTGELVGYSVHIPRKKQAAFLLLGTIWATPVATYAVASIELWAVDTRLWSFVATLLGSRKPVITTEMRRAPAISSSIPYTKNFRTSVLSRPGHTKSMPVSPQYSCQGTAWEYPET